MSDGANDSVGLNEDAVVEDVVQSRVEAVASLAKDNYDDLETAFSSSSSLSPEEDVDQVGRDLGHGNEMGELFDAKCGGLKFVCLCYRLSISIKMIRTRQNTGIFFPTIFFPNGF